MSAPVAGFAPEDLAALDAKIEAAMAAHVVPGVAVGIVAGDREYIKGYGVANVDHPSPVDGDTVFRIGSTTKTFTGTVMMRLVEQGKVDLDAPVRRYLPDFAVADADASASVTVRQLLNHTGGFLGDAVQDFGRGDDAIAGFVAAMDKLPQVTPPGSTFAYNNAGVVLAGRIIEVVTGSTYEDAVQNLLLDPLELAHTHYFSDKIVGLDIAASHTVKDGKPAVDTSLWYLPRSINPTGALISNVRDTLRYARFHLGQGDGSVLSAESLASMRSNPGAGGTLQVELSGMGLTWMLRPTAEGDTIVQHGGSWQGQQSGFFMVPSRGFAMTVLTNSDGGMALNNELFADDWALRRFAGVRNLPATAQTLSEAELTPYEGRYEARQIGMAGGTDTVVIDLSAADGHLTGTISQSGPGVPDGLDTTEKLGRAFYRPDYVIDLDGDGKSTHTRSNFVRGDDGAVRFLRSHGRLYRKVQ